MLLAGLLCGALLSAGCNVSKKSSVAARDTGCRNAPLAAGDPSVGWQKTPPGDAAQGAPLPKRFESYTISKEELDTFFAYAGKAKTACSFAVPLPEPLGCQYFTVTPSGTLPEALAAKFPGMAALKGTAVYNRNAELRLDYDGARMHAQVIWDDAVYLVMPVQRGNDVVYIIYNKKDSGEEKQPFERKVNPAMYAPPVQLPAQQGVKTAPPPVR